MCPPPPQQACFMCLCDCQASRSRADAMMEQTRKQPSSIGKQFEFCVQLVYCTLCVRRRRSKRASMCLCDSCASRSRADAMMEQTSKQPSPSGSNLNSVYNWYTAPYVSDAAAASVFHVPLRLSASRSRADAMKRADAQTAYVHREAI